MSKFNPDFWEVTISEEGWRKFSVKDGLFYEEPGEAWEREDRAERIEALWPDLLEVMDDVLTPRQRQVIHLHFLEGLNQREIGEKLGISQQSVSQHLYGKLRNGRAVGGALRKLRKACARRGVQWMAVER